MKNSIKLKHGKELAEIMKDPILLSILVQIGFNMDEETGDAVVKFSKRWEDKIGVLVVMGLIQRGSDGATFSLTNKKVIDITLKRKPTKSEIDKQDFKDPSVIPPELANYYEIAKAFWDLFYHNLTSINGRVQNLDNAKFGKWVTPIRLMIESDKVTTEQLREIWQFLKKSEFWKDKVQSTQKLRQKFETLYNQLKSDERQVSKTGKGGNSNGRKTKVSTEYVSRVLNDLRDKES